MSSENQGCVISLLTHLFVVIVAIIAYAFAFAFEVIFFVPLLLMYLLRGDPDKPCEIGVLIRETSKFVSEVAKENGL